MTHPTPGFSSGNPGHFANAPQPATDGDGWLLPSPRFRPPPNAQPEAERDNQAKLVGILRASGWGINQHPTCYTRDGEIRIPDVVVWHPQIPNLAGAVEVKASIADDRDACDALKQAIDYSRCKVLATGTPISWAAIYPFDPSADSARSAMMWGALKLASLAFKTAAFIEDADFRRWQASEARGSGRWNAGRLLLVYTECNRVWCTEHGFVGNAVEMLSGKRKVGGRRM